MKKKGLYFLLKINLLPLIIISQLSKSMTPRKSLRLDYLEDEIDTNIVVKDSIVQFVDRGKGVGVTLPNLKCAFCLKGNEIGNPLPGIIIRIDNYENYKILLFYRR